MVGVAEGEAPRRELPRGAERLGERGVVARDAFDERRVLLLDAHEARLVLLELPLLLHVSAQQPDLLDQLRQQRRQLRIHLCAVYVFLRASAARNMREGNGWPTC